MKPRDHDFQKFYYTKVGLGEGCGCAERVIDVFETDRKADLSLSRSLSGGQSRQLTLRQRGRILLNALGLTRRN